MGESKSRTRSFLLSQKVFLMFLSLFFLSCIYELYSPIPSYPVFYEIDFSSSKGKDLLSQGAYLRIIQRDIARSSIGFGGLLIIHSFTAKGTYYAYDLACPKERDARIRIDVNKNFEAECPKCKNRYTIQYGSGLPIGNSEKISLRSYTVLRTERGLLIRNDQL